MIYKPNQLESTILEIIQNKETFVVGCIYRHTSMELLSIKYHRKTLFRNKKVVLLGDFNVKCNHDVSDFLDTMHSNLLLPHITSRTRITAKPSTLIANIIISPSLLVIL